MKEELQIFFTAVSYYTCIPVPSFLPHQESYLNQSSRYLPVIGWLVGTFSFFVFFFTGYVFSFSLSIVLSIAGSVLLTGAFHEDGFADVCDGFGGGWTKDRILEIMKDSRLGTYGTIGLILIIALKFLALQQLLSITGNSFFLLLLLFIVPHTISRFTALSFIYTLQYVGKTDYSKTQPIAENLNAKIFWIAALLTIIPLVLIIVLTHKPLLILVVIPLYLQKLIMGGYFNRKIGGYTGDCLGAMQQIAEIICYLSFIVIWKFF